MEQNNETLWVDYENGWKYRIAENGYEIRGENGVYITQFDEYSKVYDPDGSFEDNCLLQLADLVKGQNEQDMIGRLGEAVRLGSIDTETFKVVTGLDYGAVFPQ